MLLIQLFILGTTIGLGFKYITNVRDIILPLVTGLTLAFIFTVVFFSHPCFNARQNMFYGVRTLFTLSNKEAWHKVNAFSSFSGSAIIFIAYLINVITFKAWNVYLFSAVLVVLVPTFIYHEFLRKKLKRETKKKDTRD